MNSEVITVGTVGTLYIGSNRYTMIIVDVLSPKRICVRPMYDDDYLNYKLGRIDGEIMIKSGRYNNESGYYDTSVIYTLRKNGRWVAKGDNMRSRASFYPGKVENYRDPSF